jgi:hypothetical protein
VSYESLLIKAVDEGFNILGKSSSEIIYDLLEGDYGISKQDIPKQFTGFSEILRRTIGPGAEPILQFIISRFYSELEIEPPRWKSVDEAVQVVQKILLRTSTTVESITGSA